MGENVVIWLVFKVKLTGVESVVAYLVCFFLFLITGPMKKMKKAKKAYKFNSVHFFFKSIEFILLHYLDSYTDTTYPINHKLQSKEELLNR